jgi:hypothetical protein
MLFRSHLSGVPVSISEFNAENYKLLNSYLNKLVPDGVEKSLHSNYLQEFFSRNLSIFGLTKEANINEGGDNE